MVNIWKFKKNPLPQQADNPKIVKKKVESPVNAIRRSHLAAANQR